MIRGFRSLHRVAFPILGIALGLLLALSRGGPDEIAMEQIPPDPPPETAPVGSPPANPVRAISSDGILVEYFGSPIDAFSVVAPDDLALPDVLLYQGDPDDFENARLLGPLRTRDTKTRYAFPGNGEYLIFYSLGRKSSFGFQKLAYWEDSE